MGAYKNLTCKLNPVMKRLVISTMILLAAVVAVTIMYFSNLRPLGQHTGRVMHTIPPNAAFIIEFNNDTGFYAIFKDNQLFTNLIGQSSSNELSTIRKEIFSNPSLAHFFSGQNVFISLHPEANNQVNFLITTSASPDFNVSMLDQLVKQKAGSLVVSPITIEGKKGYTFYSGALKKRFYLIAHSGDIFSGSFSKELIVQAARMNPKKELVPFVLISDQQTTNSLMNLYINYSQLNPLFQQLFTNKNTDIFKSFRLFSGLSALTLNYKSSAIMFSGLTDRPEHVPQAYLDLFINQQPVVNKLKDIYPSTTAYSICFAVSDPQKFKNDLSNWQVKANMQREKDSLFKKIKTETGVNLVTEFNRLLGNEFAVVTTRYQEKLAIISLKSGADIRPILNNVSTIVANNIGLLKYSKAPAFLLGDAFNEFRKPYYMILDNYLIIANSINELNSYLDSYTHHKFLNKLSDYNRFDNLLTEKSNISWFINFKDSQPALKRDLANDFYTSLQNNNPGWKNFYAASLQLTSSGKRFYTNFCMNLAAPDTTNNSNGIN
jgi:hypothetical protein